jgi:hypothetical protein
LSKLREKESDFFIKYSHLCGFFEVCQCSQQIIWFLADGSTYLLEATLQVNWGLLYVTLPNSSLSSAKYRVDGNDSWTPIDGTIAPMVLGMGIKFQSSVEDCNKALSTWQYQCTKVPMSESLSWYLTSIYFVHLCFFESPFDLDCHLSNFNLFPTRKIIDILVIHKEKWFYLFFDFLILLKWGSSIRNFS